MAYQFPEKINQKAFFRMNRSLVLKQYWAKLPLSSKTIYPVIAIHADANGKAFPSQKTIGLIAGCTPKTVREGLDGLMGFPGFRLDHWTTTRGKRACKYFVNPAPNKKGMTIRLSKAFFEGQNWSRLSSTAQALYPVMLAFSYFDFDIYESIMYAEDVELESQASEFFTNGDYEDRDFDIADPDYDSLAEYSGISYRSVKSALNSLEESYFISPTNDGEGDEYWKVLRLPSYIFHTKKKVSKAGGKYYPVSMFERR